MPEKRTPQARARTRPQLGDSWVVESDSEGNESDTQTTSPPATSSSASPTRADAVRKSQRSSTSSETPRRRTSRTSARASAEPDLIMPSIHEDDLDRSSPDLRNRGVKDPVKIPGRSQRSEGIRAEESPKTTTRRRSTVETVDRSASLKSKLPKVHESFSNTGENIEKLIKPIFSWIYDVMGGALVKLKGPISYIIAIYLLFVLLMFLQNLLFSSFYSAISPICKIPGSSLLNLPMCQSGLSSHYSGGQLPVVEFDELMTVQSKFEDVLEASAGGISLPLDMKRGESSIRDLRTVVRHSSLHSKNELVLEFDGFVDTAAIASVDLQKFNSHVGRAVDKILSINRWTMRVLEDISVRDASRSAIVTFFSSDNRFLAPFQPLKFTEDALLDQYIQHTRVVEEEIQRLVTEAQSLLFVLHNLEDRLDVIHSIAIRDDIHAKTSREELFGQLWTKLGGNGKKVAKFNSELRLLSQMNIYRKNAIAQVSGTMIQLQKMGAELEDLRSRVGDVELVGGKMGVPLSVHIENIELGIERLEEGREKAKRLDREDLVRGVDAGRGRDIEG